MPSPLAKYAADLTSLPGGAAVGYRNEGLHGVWDALAARTVHRVIRASQSTVFAQTLERIPDVAEHAPAKWRDCPPPTR